MLSSLLVAAALLCQEPDQPEHLTPWGSTPSDLVRRDNEFLMAMEDSIQCEIAEPYRKLIDRMGTPCYYCRGLWSRRLEKLARSDPGAYRWLIRGRRNKDREISLRCNAILRRLNRCEDCGGDGWTDGNYGWECSRCEGHGTLWTFWIDF